MDTNTTDVSATAKFTANDDGYDEAIEWADTHTVAGDRSWVVEGSGNPGEIYEVEHRLQTTSNFVAPGHCIRLDLSSSNFPATTSIRTRVNPSA